MADNVTVTAGTGTAVHADEYTHTTLGSGKTQLVKLVDGTLDSDAAIAVDVGAKANALRIAPANNITDGTYIGDIKFGEALPAGTNAIGKLAANSGVDIGDVDILSIAAGDNNIGNVDIVSGTITTVSTVTNLSQLGGAAIAMNEGVLGTGVQRVTLATDDDAVAHLANIVGDTNNIETAIQIIDDWDATHAAAAPANGAMIMGAGYSTGLPTDIGADADAARICTDRYGRILRGIMPQNFQATISSADAQAATAVKAKTADRKMYILSLVASTDTALNLQFQDDTGPTVLIENIHLAANGGFTMQWPPEAPLVVNTNEDFDVIASAAGNISVTITGYLAP